MDTRRAKDGGSSPSHQKADVRMAEAEIPGHRSQRISRIAPAASFQVFPKAIGDEVIHSLCLTYPRLPVTALGANAGDCRSPLWTLPYCSLHSWTLRFFQEGEKANGKIYVFGCTRPGIARVRLSISGAAGSDGILPGDGRASPQLTIRVQVSCYEKLLRGLREDFTASDGTVTVSAGALVLQDSFNPCSQGPALVEVPLGTTFSGRQYEVVPFSH